MFTWMKEVGFADRKEAGRELAERLAHYQADAPVVIGVSPGGMIVAAEIGRALDAPLDMMVVKSVCVPETAGDVVGAVALGDVAFFDPQYVTHHRLSLADLQRLTAQATLTIRRRTRRLRGRAALPDVRGRTAIVASDGIASTAAILAAIWALRSAGARRVVIALGIGAPDVVKRLREDADEVHCLLEPEPMGEISYWFRNFELVGDEEVVSVLRTAAGRAPGGRNGSRHRWTRGVTNKVPAHPHSH
jgi:putative phosphoribosyl transferase